MTNTVYTVTKDFRHNASSAWIELTGMQQLKNVSNVLVTAYFAIVPFVLDVKMVMALFRRISASLA